MITSLFILQLYRHYRMISLLENIESGAQRFGELEPGDIFINYLAPLEKRDDPP